MDLLIFFAFPIATIIFSAILQMIIKKPIAVAAFIFAIFLIVTFAVYDVTFLIATLVYTILALITAIITCILSRNNDNDESMCENISDLLSSNANDNSNCGCGCNRYKRR